MLSCQTGLTNCSGTCVNLQTDNYNCGTCATTCPSGQVCTKGSCAVTCAAGLTNCSGVCVNLQTSNANCGSCGSACSPGQACKVGKCTVSCGDGKLDPGELCDGTNVGAWTCKLQGFDGGTLKCKSNCAGFDTSGCTYDVLGSGKDGALTHASGTKTINTVRATATGTKGSTTLSVSTVSGFAAQQLVVIHQTMGTGAGTWEEAYISAVGSGSFTLSKALKNTYATGGSVNRAQVVMVPQYTTVTVSGGTLTAPVWNGSTGGILAFVATGNVTISGGTVNMSGNGYLGYGHGCFYRCKTGFRGQSPTGFSSASTYRNGMGGGAGEQGQDCGAGGGGGYGSAGAKGSNGSNGTCRVHSPIWGGQGGSAGGSTNTSTNILFGGAGGEGGGDEDGAYPGRGGDGGGLIIIRGANVSLGGYVRTNGASGANGNQGACGGRGCGMGGGGGGAGGGVYIYAANNASLSSNRVTASGAGGGTCNCSSSYRGGTGGVGRIAVRAKTISGTTSPTYVKLSAP